MSDTVWKELDRANRDALAYLGRQKTVLRGIQSAIRDLQFDEQCLPEMRESLAELGRLTHQKLTLSLKAERRFRWQLTMMEAQERKCRKALPPRR